MTSYNLYTKFGNRAKDQRVEVTAEGETFFSYNTPIARKRVDGSIELFPAWNYSATTNYYRGQFLGEGINETRRKVALGEYTHVKP